MKSKKFEFNCTPTRVFVALALMGASIMLAGTQADAATVADLFKFLPPAAHVAVGLPDIQGVEQAGAPLLKLPFLSRISEAAVALGGDTLSEALSNSGIRVNAPAAVFLQGPSVRDVSGALVLLVADADKVRETLLGLIGSEGSEIDLPGDIKGRFVSGSNVGYFIEDDTLFVASTQELLQQLAARIAAPADVNYGKSSTKDEVVIWSRIDIIEENNLLQLAEPLAMLEPLLKAIKPFSDEVLFAIGEDMGKAYIRMAARDISGTAVASPGPLALHGFMDPDSPILLNLRLTPELINVVSTILITNESTRQAGGYMRIAGGLLGDELAVSFKGMKQNSIPDAVIAATVKQAATVPNLLKMVAKIEEPTYQHEEKDVYVYKNISDGTDLHIAVADETLVVAPGEDALKTALETFSKSSADTGVPTSIVNQGVFGFAVIDGAKAKDLPPGLIPSNINIAEVNLAIMLGLDNEWREVMLTSPAGFKGLAATLRGLL